MNIRKNLYKFLVATLLLTPMACGRYGDPQPPEYFAPQGVNELVAIADINGIELKWEAPDRDRSGDKLKSIEGYFINRKIITKPSDVLDPEIEDETIATISDTHLEVLKEMRKKAIEEGRISRKVTVDKALTQFHYIDTNVNPGVTYIYSVVPFNQGQTEGLVPQQVKVLYRGDASVVTFIETDEGEKDKLRKNKAKRKAGLF